MSIALLTNKTFLMRRTEDGLWENFLDIIKCPQLGGEAEIIDITRLHDTRSRYMLGLIDSAPLAFEMNYTQESYAKASDPSVTDVLNVYRVCFGDEMGTDGCWEWSGKTSVHILEGEPNAVRKMVVTFSDEGEEPLTEVTYPELFIERNEMNGLTYIVNTMKYRTEENDSGGITHTIDLISTSAENDPDDSDLMSVMYDDDGAWYIS